jgi:hypothetical protein
MKTEIVISLTSPDQDLNRVLSNIGIVGATFNYGINKLPTVNVHINPAGLGLLCDFDLARRRNVTVRVNSTLGCLQFDGVIDGQSISQQPGSLTASLIVKHKFIFLNEVYPRILGLHAGSSNMFAINQPITWDSSHFANTVPGQAQAGNFLATNQQLYGYELLGLRTDLQIIDFIVGLCKVIVQSQLASKFLKPTDIYQESSNSLAEVIQAAQINAQNQGKVVLDLIKMINTDFTQGFVLKACAPGIASKIIEDISLLEDTLFSSLIKLLNQYGCVFVVGHNSAFIIPETPFLKVTKNQNLKQKRLSSQYNVALPADYETFNFQDVGDNTIKGVYVIHEPLGASSIYGAAGTDVINGSFIDPNPNVFGNIVVKTLPNIATTYMSYAACHGSQGIQQNIKNKSRLISGPLQTMEANTAMQKTHDALARDVYQPIKNYMNQWAEIEYCRIKYSDRVGSINLPFSQNWTPGAPGSIYTRNPGTYIDFYVTDVSHNFSISGPNSGSANTTVSFNGGRPGAATQDGLDRISLYDYSYSDSLDFCDRFVRDIAGR